jgi:hypothetical protein
MHIHTAISIKVVHEQSGKVEYERDRLLRIANKLMNFQRDSQQPFALVFDFSALLVDNLKVPMQRKNGSTFSVWIRYFTM